MTAATSNEAAGAEPPAMSSPLLIVRIGSRVCGLAAQYVVETMRPLPCQALPQAPSFVRGVSLIRARPTPVVDLCVLLAGEPLKCPTRVVTVSSDRARQVGLLVDEVLGLRQAHEVSLAPLPALLEDARSEGVQELARLDGRLLTILQTGKLVPEAVWQQLQEQGQQP